MIKEVEILPDPTTEKLAESFMKLGSQSTVANVGSNKEPEVQRNLQQFRKLLSQVPVS